MVETALPRKPTPAPIIPAGGNAIPIVETIEPADEIESPTPEAIPTALQLAASLIFAELNRSVRKNTLKGNSFSLNMIERFRLNAT